MLSEDYRPRFSFEITEEQKNRAELLLSAHGVKKALFGIILDDVLDKIESHGERFIIAVTAQLAKPTELIQSMKRAEEIIKEFENVK